MSDYITMTVFYYDTDFFKFKTQREMVSGYIFDAAQERNVRAMADINAALSELCAM